MSPSPITHRLWLILGSVITVAAVGVGTVQTVSALAHDEHAEVTTFATDGITLLDVDNDSGSVEVTGADVDEIAVTAEISDGLFDSDHRIDVEGSRLVIRASCPWLSTWCEVDYHIVVPADLAVVLRVDNGRITARDLTGDVDADGDNGTVELIRIGGDVDASTDNGRVTASGLRAANVEADADNGSVHLTFAEAPTSVRATTDNGSVEVVVPETDDVYRVDVRTSHGSQDVGVRTDPDSDRSIVAETHNGSVTVRYPSG
jgi:Putative adhesin